MFTSLPFRCDSVLCGESEGSSIAFPASWTFLSGRLYSIYGYVKTEFEMHHRTLSSSFSEQNSVYVYTSYNFSEINGYAKDKVTVALLPFLDAGELNSVNENTI